MPKVLRFVKVSVMLCWRMAVLGLALFTVQPGWGGYPLLVVGVPVVVAGVLVFGLRRTMLVFPILRALQGSHPFPDETELARRDEAARAKARERSAEHRRVNPEPSALFDRSPARAPLAESDLDEHQRAEVAAAFGVILDHRFRTLSTERESALRTREAEASTSSRGNYLYLENAREHHTATIYRDAAASARAQVRATYGLTGEGRLALEQDAIDAHRRAERRRRREPARTADGIRSAAERRTLFDEHETFVRARLRVSSPAQQRLLGALIDAALARAGETTMDMISDSADTSAGELTPAGLRAVVTRNGALASSEQVGVLLTMYDLDGMDMAVDSFLLLRDLFELTPMSPAIAHDLAIEHLADRHRLADGGEVQKILDLIRY